MQKAIAGKRLTAPPLYGSDPPPLGVVGSSSPFVVVVVLAVVELSVEGVLVVTALKKNYCKILVYF